MKPGLIFLACAGLLFASWQAIRDDQDSAAPTAAPESVFKPHRSSSHHPPARTSATHSSSDVAAAKARLLAKMQAHWERKQREAGGRDSSSDHAYLETHLRQRRDPGPATTVSEEEIRVIHKEGTVLPTEVEVLELYENIAAEFSHTEESCSDLGEAMLEFVQDGRPAVGRLDQARSELDTEDYSSASARLETNAAPQLNRLRQSLRRGFARCAGEPSIRLAIEMLATPARE